MKYRFSDILLGVVLSTCILALINVLVYLSLYMWGIV